MTEQFDPRLVSAVLEAVESHRGKFTGLSEDTKFVLWTSAPSLARRVMELEAERDEKTNGRTYREWAERMDDCRVAAEQENYLFRERLVKAEELLKEVAEDYSEVGCTPINEGGLEMDWHHGDDCVLKKVRAWIAQPSDA